MFMPLEETIVNYKRLHPGGRFSSCASYQHWHDEHEPLVHAPEQSGPIGHAMVCSKELSPEHQAWSWRAR